MPVSPQLIAFRAKLMAIAPAVVAAVRPAMEQSAQEIVDGAKALVPVESGVLRDSIGWTWGGAPAGSITLADAVDNGNTITIYAGNSEAFYGRWVEFGAVHAAAHPYFYTSYRLYKARGQRRERRVMNKAVKENWAGQ